VFIVHLVRTSRKELLEPLGTKRKFWYIGDQGNRILFKAEDRGTGEDWAEKVACELCGMLGLPHIQYELAVESERNVPGVICENCAEPPTNLVLGNELLLKRDPSYPTHETQRYKIRQHTVGAVIDVLENLKTPSAPWDIQMPSGIQSALGVFVGYVMLDAWIANQDRHHENWGALRKENVLYLAPTFDHAASMARNMQDKEREERLKTNDTGYQIKTFALRATSALYHGPDATRPMTTFEAWNAFADKLHSAASVWLNKLRDISSGDIDTILEAVPEHRLTKVGRRFTKELLLENQRRLCDGD